MSNSSKIERISVNVFRLYFGYFRLWINAIKESLIYLNRGCTLGFIRNFLASVKNCIYRTEFLKLNTSKQAIFFSYFFDDIAVSLALLKQQNGLLHCVSRTHGFETFHEQAPFKHIPFQKFKVKYIDFILPVSQQGTNVLKNEFKSYRNKINCLYLGISPHNFISPISDELHIVSCSYIRGIKRVELIVKALQQIEKPIKWTHIGDGEDFEKIRQLSKQLPINVTVNLLGKRNEGEIIEFYKNTPVTCFISTSFSEGLPLTMIEAISFGIPIVATNVGGCNELVNNITGVLLHRDFKISELVDSIYQMQTNSKNTQQGRDKIKQFWALNFSSNHNYLLLKKYFNVTNF